MQPLSLPVRKFLQNKVTVKLLALFHQLKQDKMRQVNKKKLTNFPSQKYGDFIELGLATLVQTNFKQVSY